MDILTQYEKENPTVREPVQENQGSLENRDYLIGLVIRLSIDITL